MLPWGTPQIDLPPLPNVGPDHINRLSMLAVGVVVRHIFTPSRQVRPYACNVQVMAPDDEYLKVVVDVTHGCRIKGMEQPPKVSLSEIMGVDSDGNVVGQRPPVTYCASDLGVLPYTDDAGRNTFWNDMNTLMLVRQNDLQ